VQLLELNTVKDDFDDLLDLLQTTLILPLDVWDEELEEVRAHLVVSDGLASDLLLLH
jgi:hypothetical protein